MADEKYFEVFIDNFERGMFTNIDEPQKPSNGFKEMKNGWVDDKLGTFVKRDPSTKYNATSLGANPIMGGERYYYGDTNKELIIAYDTMLKTGDDGLGTFSNIKTGLTSGKRWEFLQYKDMLYGFNGEDSNQRYDGTNIRDMGVPAPASAPTLNAYVGGGSLSGDYQYKITFVYDDYQESNPSDASGTLTPSSQNVTIDILTSSDSACTARKIYRTTDGGSTFKYVATVSNNTATTYTDSLADGSLGDDAPDDNASFPICTMAQLHKDRIFGLVPNSSKIVYTPIVDYSSYPDMYHSQTAYEYVNEDDGQDVLSIVATNEGIVCFKRTSAFIIRTFSNDPLQWQIDKIDNHGTCSAYTPRLTDFGIVFVTRDKNKRKDLRLMQGTSGSVSIGFRMRDTINDIADNYIDKTIAKYYGGRYYLSYVSKSSGQSHQNRCLVVTPSANEDSQVSISFVMLEYDVSAFIPCQGEGDEGQMYVGLSDIGYILRLDTTSEDFMHQTSTDINTGTITRLTEGGTEENPEFTLDSTAFGSLIASQDIDDLTGDIADYNDADDDFIDYSGYIESEALYIGASSFNKLYWGSATGTNGYIWAKIRTADTESGITSASWSEFFKIPSGSDISGVTAKDWMQYRLYVFSDDLPDANTKVCRPSNYVVKLSAGFGSAYESAINFVFDTGLLDLGYKDYIKQIDSLAFEYEAEGSTLYVYGKIDEETEFGDAIEEIDLSTNPNIRQIILPFDYVCEYFNIKLVEQSTSKFHLKSIRIRGRVLPKEAYILSRGG